jgi:hypothetical protein
MIGGAERVDEALQLGWVEVGGAEAFVLEPATQAAHQPKLTPCAVGPVALTV